MHGCEWIVEAHGCEPAALASLEKLSGLFERIIDALDLRPVGEPVWHQFPDCPGTGLQHDGLPVMLPGGITGLCLLSESHLTCHTFPEHGSLCLNLFCCRPRPDWNFSGELKREFGASVVQVRRLERPYGDPAQAVSA